VKKAWYAVAVLAVLLYGWAVGCQVDHLNSEQSAGTPAPVAATSVQVVATATPVPTRTAEPTPTTEPAPVATPGLTRLQELRLQKVADALGYRINVVIELLDEHPAILGHIQCHNTADLSGCEGFDEWAEAEAYFMFCYMDHGFDILGLDADGDLVACEEHETQRAPRTQQAPCNCGDNEYNCSDFSSQAAAQQCYQHCGELTGYDVHWLDGDSDGVACE